MRTCIAAIFLSIGKSLKLTDRFHGHIKCGTFPQHCGIKMLASILCCFSFNFSNLLYCYSLKCYSSSFPLLHCSSIGLSLSFLTETIFYFPTCLVSLYSLLSASSCSSVSGWKAPVLVIHSHNTPTLGLERHSSKQGAYHQSQESRGMCTHTPTNPSENTAQTHTQLSIATECTYSIAYGLVFYFQNLKEV